MIQKPLSMIQNTLFVNLMTQNTLFMATIEKIITHALGEHYPGSAQDGRTSSEMQSSGYGSLFHRVISALNEANIC